MIDGEIFLPEHWLDEEHREDAKIPSHLSFRSKPELAIVMTRGDES